MAGVRVTICGVNTKDLPLLSAKDKKNSLQNQGRRQQRT